MNNLVYQGVGSLESGLFATPPERLGFKSGFKDGVEGVQDESEYPEARQEIEEGLHKLETLLNSTVDKNFDKFEIYVLRNIMAVPQDLVNWIKLSHYEVCAARWVNAPTKLWDRKSNILSQQTLRPQNQSTSCDENSRVLETSLSFYVKRSDAMR